MKSKIAYEVMYHDDSGIEKAVRLDMTKFALTAGDPGLVEFETVADVVQYPLADLDWLIACLTDIQKEIKRFS